MGITNSKGSSDGSKPGGGGGAADTSSKHWADLLAPKTRGPQSHVALSHQSGGGASSPSAETPKHEKTGCMMVHTKARLLKLLSHETLMNNFLESPFETFALTPAELTQLLQVSFRADIEPIPVKGEISF